MTNIPRHYAEAKKLLDLNEQEILFRAHAERCGFNGLVLDTLMSQPGMPLRLDQPIAHGGDAFARKLKELRDKFEPKKTESYIREIIQKNREAICSRICNEKMDTLLEKLKDDEDEAYVIAAVADFISALALGINPVTISYVLFKYGYKKLCSEHD